MFRNDEKRICYGCMRKLSESGECPCGWRNTYDEEERETFLRPGTLLDHGQYLVGRALGRGGFGITYLGRKQDELGLKVAIKEYFPKKLAGRRASRSGELFRLSPTDTGEEALKERYERGKAGFIEEARRLAAFRELPSIVGVLGYFEENNTAYIVMEHVDGIDLQQYMRRRGRTLTVEEVKRFIVPVAEDLCQVHEAGIVHRDISPDNIMISRNGKVKLIDFGASVSQGKSAHILRKNGFAPPEQYESEGENLGPWTDVYALCATIYMLLSGKILQDSRDRERADAYKTLRSMCIMVPIGMDRLLKRGLCLNWRKRCPSARELAAGLKRVRCGGRFRGWAGAGACLTVCLAVCLAGYLYRYRWEEREMPVLGEALADSRMTERAALGERDAAWAALDYAVYGDMVYIRYVFEDGTIMLMRSPVGTDDFSQVEYVTDGKMGRFCVYQGYLYLSGEEDRCIYRADLTRLMALEDGERPLEKIGRSGLLEKISEPLANHEYGFYIEDGYLYSAVKEEGYELRRMSVDGGEQYGTALALGLTNLVFCDGYLFFTVSDGDDTVLHRMRLDGRYYQELARFQGSVPAMRIWGDTLYYLLNGKEEGCLGSIGLNGAQEKALVRRSNQDLQYCDMTGIVDGNHIYYTCSVEGTEMLNNLYCYSLEDGNNRQISSECGRYIVTSDDIPYIIFASMDGMEIRQMNKDGSNPRVMREADGGTGITEKVDVTSLAIIRDHVYYLDGGSVAYKEIEAEEL